MTRTRIANFLRLAAADWRRIRPGLVRLVRRLLILAALVLGLVALLWGARVSCEMNPSCPWSHFWSR